MIYSQAVLVACVGAAALVSAHPLPGNSPYAADSTGFNQHPTVHGQHGHTSHSQHGLDHSQYGLQTAGHFASMGTTALHNDVHEYSTRQEDGMLHPDPSAGQQSPPSNKKLRKKAKKAAAAAAALDAERAKHGLPSQQGGQMSGGSPHPAMDPQLGARELAQDFDRRDHDLVKGAVAITAATDGAREHMKKAKDSLKKGTKELVLDALTRRHPNEEAALVARDIFEDLYARYFDEIDEID